MLSLCLIDGLQKVYGFFKKEEEIVMANIRTGGIVEQSGIYKCTNTSCGNEITCVKGERVPPCRKCGNTEFRLVRATR